MDNALCRIKMIFLEYSLAFITVYLKQTPNGREATASISPKDSSDVVTMLPEELSVVLNKIEESDIDGIISAEDPPSTAPSNDMKLYKYDCGKIYRLEHRNCCVKLDRELINALLYAEERIHSYLP